MTQLRFQADADLRQAIVAGVMRRQPNLDFQSANVPILRNLLGFPNCVGTADAIELTINFRTNILFCNCDRSAVAIGLNLG